MSVDEEYLQTLLRTFSHDAGSALRAASGFSKLLAEQYGDKLDEKALHWLSLIRSESESSQRQLKSLSQYARLYAVGDISSSCNLMSVYQEAQEEAAVQQALLKHPSIRFDVSPLLTVVGNAKVWRQYFVEILVNCIRYSSPQGKPVICRVFMEESEGHVSLIIEDDGAGLSFDNIVKVMQPYRSLEANGNEDEYSAVRQGMGLSIAKRIVELHGGVFSVTARPDGISGLRVEARLPVAQV